MKFDNQKVNKLLNEMERILKRVQAIRKGMDEDLAKMKKQAA